MPDLHKVNHDMIYLAKKLTHDHGFICLPTADKIPLARGWQKFTETCSGDEWGLAKGVGIQTGQRSGVTVVDIDEPDVPFFEKFMKHFDVKPTTWVITPGNGYHLYFKYNGELPQGNFEPLKWDIRNDGGYIMAPGSYYTNPKKPKMNWKKYQFKKLEDGTVLDWDHIRDLDPEFLRAKHYGINQETMEFGEKRLTFQTKENKQRETRDNNKKLFMKLMNAYAAQKGSGYREWLHGVWAIKHICTEYNWDAEKFAVAWSKELGGFDGPDKVTAKLKEYSKDKGSFNLQWLLSKVPEENRKWFNKFKRQWYYNDYQQLFRHGIMDMAIVEQYVSSVFVRVDRMTKLMWYGKVEDGVWEPISPPFKNDNPCMYKYYAANPKYKPNDPSCQAPEFIVKENHMRATVQQHFLDWVPNYRDLQFLPYYGEDPTPSGVFNVFKSYVHDVYPPDEYDERDEGLLFVLNHWREFMCDANDEFFMYLMRWLAWQLRYGWKKIKTAIAMHGGQGMGKCLMWTKLIMYGIVGERNVSLQHDLSQFTGRFNMKRLGKVFHIFDECTALNGGNKVNWDTMKAVITDRDFMAEPKGKESFAAVDCAGCILLSNHQRCVDIPNDDRRYAIIETSKKKPDKAYFRRLAAYVEDKHVQRSFFTYLMSLDLENYDWRDIPNTQSREDAQNARGENRILDFLVALVLDDIEFDIHGPWFVTKHNEEKLKRSQRFYCEQRVYEEYRRWLESAGVASRYIPTRQSMISDLTHHGLQKKYVFDRSFHWEEGWVGKQRHCLLIDKASVRDINRTKRKKPTWDYELL